jgi:hypothetical protein
MKAFLGSVKVSYKPFEYYATKLTSKNMQDLLPNILEKIGKCQGNRGDLIMAVWPEIIGEKLSPMTQASSFEDGILTVKVKNQVLYSHLSQYEKPKLLDSLKKKFPKVEIRNIVFRIN